MKKKVKVVTKLMRVSDDYHKLLKLEGVKRGRPMQAVLDEACEMYLNREPSLNVHRSMPKVVHNDLKNQESETMALFKDLK